MSDRQNLAIREYRDSDAAAVVELARQMQVAELPFDHQMKPVADVGPWYVDTMLSAVADGRGVILVAELDGRCVGLACLLTGVVDDGSEELLPHVTAHIRELAVADSVRGRGIGKALIDECERRAKTAGRSEMTLAVYADNVPARGLYAKSGFRDLKVRMRKALG